MYCLKKFEANINSEDSLEIEYESRSGRNLASNFKNTQSIRPFLLNENENISDCVEIPDRAGTSTCIYQPTTERSVSFVCHTCYKQFPFGEIEMHADVCASQFDPIGTTDLETELEIPSIKEDMNLFCSEKPLEDPVSGDGDDNARNTLREQIKEAITALQNNVDQNIDRLSVRRRYAFQDYVAAC